MPQYQTIKELVLDAYASEGEMPSCTSLTSKVREHFPNSKWQKSHYTWYKSQINTGRIPVADLDSQSSVSESEIEEEISESVLAQVSLERDVNDYFAQRIEEIETGLVLCEGGVEYRTEAGNIDLLAKDSQGNLVVIELKAGKAKDAALGQILGYIGALQGKTPAIRGIIIASEFEPRVVFGVRSLPNIRLVKYELNFILHPVT